MSSKPAFNPDSPFEVADEKPPFDPNAPHEVVEPEAPKEDPGLLALGGEYLGKAVKKLDAVTGAPTRAALGALQKGDGLSGATHAFGEQFNADPDLAPSGKELAQRAGLDAATPLSERIPWAFTDKPGLTLQAKKGGFLDVTPAGAAGLGIDVLADPTNLIPGKAVSKTFALGGKASAIPFSKTAEVLETMARRRAAKQAGAVTIGDLRRLDRNKSLERVGKEALDSGIVTPLSGSQTILDRAQDLKKQAGSKIGEFKNAIDSRFGDVANSDLREHLFHPTRVADRWNTELVNKLGVISADLGKEVGGIGEKLKSLGEGPIPFAEAEKLKQQLDQRIPWNKNAKEWTPQEKLLKDAREILNEEIENGVEKITERTTHPQAFDQWKQAKREYGAGKEISKMSQDKIFRDTANRFLSPSDYGVGAATGLAASVQNPEDRFNSFLMGAAGAGVNKFARKYGNALSATGARKASQVFDAIGNNIKNAAVQVNPKAGYQIGMGISRSSQKEDHTPISDQSLDVPEITSKLTRAQANSLSGTKYARQLLEAARRGGDAVSTTHFILSQQDPEYQALMKKANTR